jgi:hypothetical protein
MLEAGEIATIEELIPQARAAVEQLEAQATGFMGWLLRDDAHQKAAVARDLFNVALAQYQTSQASPDPQHEEALAVVETLHHLVDSEWVAQAATSPSPAAAAWSALRQGARSVKDALLPNVDLGAGLSSAVGWVKIVLVVLVVALALFVFYKFARLFQ